MSKRKKDVVRSSYADYLCWPEGERIELINGVPFAMTPAPSREHQRLVVELLGAFYTFLKGHTCEVYIAPFDVRFSKDQDVTDEEVDTVVLPDLSVICDKEKLDERGCNGAPDLIVEVISPSTASNDYIYKYKLYEQHGVKEYWLVHPIDQIVTVFLLGEDKQFKNPIYYDKDGCITVSTLPGFSIEVAKLFL